MRLCPRYPHHCKTFLWSRDHWAYTIRPRALGYNITFCSTHFRLCINKWTAHWLPSAHACDAMKHRGHLEWKPANELDSALPNGGFCTTYDDADQSIELPFRYDLDRYSLINVTDLGVASECFAHMSDCHYLHTLRLTNSLKLFCRAKVGIILLMIRESRIYEVPGSANSATRSAIRQPISVVCMPAWWSVDVGNVKHNRVPFCFIYLFIIYLMCAAHVARDSHKDSSNILND